MGLPKALQTPVAAPQATKSRFSRSLRKSLNLEKLVSTPKKRVLPWEAPAATTAPECTMGPSLPTGKPAATEKVTPITLHNNVLTRTTLGRSIPFKKHLTSGMPEPPETGSIQTKMLAIAAKTTFEFEGNNGQKSDSPRPRVQTHPTAIRTYLGTIQR